MSTTTLRPAVPAAALSAASSGRVNLFALYAGNGLALSGLRLQTMIFAWLALGVAGQGWAGLINGLPAAAACLCAAWGGLVADSQFARRALTLARLGLAGVALGTASLSAIGVAYPALLLMLSLAFAGLTAFDTPIARSLLFQARGERPLLKVTSANSMALNALNIVGPTAVGFILTRYSGSIALLLLTACYLAAALLSRIGAAAPEVRIRAAKGLLADLTAGFGHLRNDRQLGWLMSLVLIVPLAGMFFATLPLYARDILGVGPGGFGLLMAGYGCGNLAGSAYFAAGNKVEQRGLAILTLGMTYGIGMVVFATLSNFIACIVVAAAMGTTAMIWQNLIGSTIQQQAPAEVQGRVMSVYTMGIQLLSLGWLLSAGLSVVIGARVALMVAGFAAIGLNLLVAKRSTVRLLA